MDQGVKIWREGRAGRIRLNRPRSLNALDLAMLRLIHAALDDFAGDPTVHVVLLDAAGERGFCAGGDIRHLRASAMAGDSAGVAAFFSAEYALNQAIADFPKPYVALIDGVCLGGGVGISVHGSHRIVTERAMLAMPETAIGLFPDVGTSFVLPRLPGALGMYLGLTGARMHGADAVHAGLATHFVPSARLGELAQAIVRDGVAVIAEFTAPLPAFSLASERVVIDSAFSAGSVMEIVARLAEDDGTFAAESLAQIRSHSPSAVYWSFEIIRQGASRDLGQCLEAEFALMREVAMGADFLEGVRAMLVEKDRLPKWQPARLEDIELRAFFP